MEWIESYRGKERPDGTWTAEPGCMVSYFALTLFADIRPDWQDGEIGKLQQKDIRLDTGVIVIEPGVSKVNEKRTIKIQPNLRLWLEKYPLDRYPIIPARRFREMWLDVRKQKKLAHDVLRHTYISMTVGAFRSVGDAALQAGNSEAVIRKHYSISTPSRKPTSSGGSSQRAWNCPRNPRRRRVGMFRQTNSSLSFNGLQIDHNHRERISLSASGHCIPWLRSVCR